MRQVARRGGSRRPSGGSLRRSSGLLSSRARFAARAARVRRRPWLLAAGLAVFLAVVSGGVWLVELSPALVSRSVRVEGVPKGDVSNIVRRAAVPMGVPLAQVDTDAIAGRVTLDAALANVSVSRSYPSTIVISASRKVPVLAVKNPQGQLQVVDSHGDVFATVRAVPKGVPLINTVENPPSRQSLRGAMAVLRSLSAAQRRKVTNVTVQGPNMITLKLGAVTVVWGGASEPDLKVKVLTVLLRQNHVGTIDVSAPRTPVIR